MTSQDGTALDMCHAVMGTSKPLCHHHGGLILLCMVCLKPTCRISVQVASNASCIQCKLHPMHSQMDAS